MAAATEDRCGWRRLVFAAGGLLVLLVAAGCPPDSTPGGLPEVGVPDVSPDIPTPDGHTPDPDAAEPGPDVDARLDAAPGMPDGAADADAGPGAADADIAGGDADLPSPPADADVEGDLYVPFEDVGDVDTFVVPDVGQGDAPEEVSGGEGCSTELDCAPGPCTSAACDGGQCIYLPVAGPCDDLNPCTAGDACDKGECVPGDNVCEELCGNGLDDDLDGAVDCGDEECAELPGCALQCAGQEIVGCGEVVFDDTGKLTATQLVDGLCGGDGSGSEVVYQLDLPADLVSVTAEVDGDAWVEIVSGGGIGVCDGAACLDGGAGGATWEVDGSPDGSAFLVVDSGAGVEGPFALSVSCTFPVVEYCSNEVDDDGDGLIDCDDPDCEPNPICGAPIEFCANGIDDDLDGDTDCADSECVGTFDCVAPPGCDPLYVLVCGSTLEDQLGAPGSTDFVDEWACGVSGLDGPEIAHSFTATQDAQVVVTAEGAPAGSWLLVVEDADECEPTSCVAAGEGTVTFDAVGGTSYALVLDAPDGATGSFVLSIGCLGMEVCGNLVDDDQDGATDCEDVDCYGQAPCGGQLCSPELFVDCDESLSGSLAATGALSLGGCGPTGDAGEAVVAFSAFLPSQAVVSVGGPSDPRVFVLDGAGLCDTELCVTGGADQASFPAGEGSTWYLVVDSDHAGAWTMTVNCSGEELWCDDGLDGDADGAADCADADCAGTPGCDAACPVLGTITCGNSPLVDPAEVTLPAEVDAYGCPDAAGLTGTEAGWMVELPPGSEGPVQVRAVLLDPAGSGATVVAVTSGAACDPASCFAADDEAIVFDLAPGEKPFLVVDRAAGTSPLGLVINCGDSETTCDDDIDGDGDGLEDCADPDCFDVALPCEFAEVVCDDGLDNDADQLTDCEDLDCAGIAECPNGPGICVPHEDVLCGEPLSGATDGPGSQQGTMLFQCPGGQPTADHGTITWVYYGNGQAVTFHLVDATPSSRLVVIEGADCNPAKCVASTDSAVVVQTQLDQAYSLVLTAPTAEPASGIVEVVCGVGEVDCGNGIDDNADGTTDCLDPSCAAVANCQYCYGVEEIACGAQVTFTATSGAGNTALVDGTCGGPPSPGPERVFLLEPAESGVVTLDSLSAGAVLHAFGPDGEACAADACLAGGLPPITFYGKQGDFYLIAADTTGAGSDPATLQVACVTADELCDDQLDNDEDGWTDCQDPACSGDAACGDPEDCDDGVDNDLDGATDCKDADCKLFGDCPDLEDCVDGIDNDEDGWTDCKDVVCKGFAGCTDQEVCDDGVDNDGDGATDCGDNLCTVDPVCLP